MTGRDALLLILMAVALLLVIEFVFAPIGCGGWGMMGHMPIMGYEMYLMMFLIPLLFVVILVTGAYYLFKIISGTQERGRALDIIKERYARGEQYRKMREELR